MDSSFILGLDVSLTSTGYAIVELFSDGSYRLVDKGRVKTYSKDPDGVRLWKIRLKISEIVDKYSIGYVVRERGFTGGSPLSTQQIFKATGVIEQVLAERGLKEITQDEGSLTVGRNAGGVANWTSSSRRVVQLIYKE